MILSSPFGLYAYPTGAVGPADIPGYIVATDLGAGDGITRDAYEPGNEIRLTAQVFAVGAIPTDPETMTLTIQAPAIVSSDPLPTPVVLTLGQLTRTATGHWEYVDLVITPGQWLYRVATTSPVADTGSRSFWVLAP